MKKILMLTAAIFTFQALPAVAQDDAAKKDVRHGKHGERIFNKLDTNGDGVIAEAEFLAHAKTRFDAMDANKDGQVTKEEAKAHHEAKRAEWKEKRAKMKAGKEKSAE